MTIDALTFLRSKSFDQSAGAYSDPDGIKTSIATAATAQTYQGSALNGTSTVGKAIATGSHGGNVSWPTATASSAAASYVAASTIVFTGTYGGVVVERTAALTTANGNETVIADGPLDHGSITKIVVAAQVDTAGAFTFGWTGIGPKKGYAWLLVAREAGSIVVSAAEGGDDTVLLPIHAQHPVLVNRIFAAQTIDVTAYEIERS